MKKFSHIDFFSWIALTFCVALLLVSGYVAVNAYLNNRANEVNNLLAQGQTLATAFNHELNVQAMSLEILAAEADSVIAGDNLPIRMTSQNLILSADQQGYILKIPEGKTANQVGSLTGIGAIPETGSALAKEIDMALSLSPAFEQVIFNNATLPWVYYTSASQFIYMYPAVPPEEFFYSDVLQKTEFFTIATPENDPERVLVWSPPYEDQAGAGRMVTLSKPIYEGDRFLGVLSIDILLTNFQWLLDNGAPSLAEAHLLGPDQVCIVSDNGDPLSIDVLSLEHEKLIEIDDKAYIIFTLPENNWHLVYEVDQSKLRVEAINASTNEIIIFLFVVFSVLLIFMIYQNMRTARFMAAHDNLTGLLNRRSFDGKSLESISKHVPSDEYLGAAIIDIDYFKKYNDLYGHLAGDETLRRVANAIKNGLRSSSDEVFRVGGEEFIALFTLTSPDDLPPILDRLVKGVSDLGIPHAESPFEIVTISAGGTCERLDKLSSVEEIYSRADRVLFSAKESGRNRWIIG